MILLCLCPKDRRQLQTEYDDNDVDDDGDDIKSEDNFFQTFYFPAVDQAVIWSKSFSIIDTLNTGDYLQTYSSVDNTV